MEALRLALGLRHGLAELLPRLLVAGFGFWELWAGGGGGARGTVIRVP